MKDEKIRKSFRSARSIKTSEKVKKYYYEKYFIYNMQYTIYSSYIQVYVFGVPFLLTLVLPIYIANLYILQYRSYIEIFVFEIPFILTLVTPIYIGNIYILQ